MSEIENKYTHFGEIKFSVVIPLFNKEISVISTIESVLNQTYPHFELIIVNDGSTDNSLEVVQQFDDPRLRIIDKANGGVSSARNAGIKASIGEYVAFLDADDFWYINALEEFRNLIVNYSKAKVFVTNYIMTGMTRNENNRSYYVEDYCFIKAQYLIKWSKGFMWTGCVCAKRDCFDVVGYFQEGVTNGEDVDMWERLSMVFKIAKSECITTIYRTDAENRNKDMNPDDRTEPTKPTKSTALCNSSSVKILQAVSLMYNLRNNYNKQNITLIYIIRNIPWIVISLFYFLKLRIFNKPIIVK